MRTLNEREKKLVCKILQQQTFNSSIPFGTLCNDYFSIDGIAVVLQFNSQFTKSGILVNVNNRESKKSKGMLGLMQLLSFVDFLESNGYIRILHIIEDEAYIFGGFDDSSLGIMRNFESYIKNHYSIEIDQNYGITLNDENGTNLMSGEITSAELALDIKHTLGSIVYPTQKLKDFFDNDFKTEVDIRYEQNKKLSIRAIILSVIAILIAIASPVASLLINNWKGHTTIDQKQFQILKEDIDSIKNYENKKNLTLEQIKNEIKVSVQK